ncbi:MAG: DUF3794 domain-containing protein [Anaerovoracaceae bacterium]
MTYEEKIPEFALRPAKAVDGDTEEMDDGFDPTPYDRLLSENLEMGEEEEVEELEAEEKPQQEELQKEIEEIKVQAPMDQGKALEIEPLNTTSEATKITPLSSSTTYDHLSFTGAVEKEEVKIFIEEDILVPDIKADLISILSMEGTPILSSKEFQVGQGEEDQIKLKGEISIHTIYVPDSKDGEGQIATIQSRVPFKTDWQGNASPLSHIGITPIVEKIDFTVINERKFRVKITLILRIKEYAEKEVSIFGGLNGEKLQLLKEPVKMSHVAVRKKEEIEISEIFKIKEEELKPVKILKHNINIVENHKQVTSEKLVVNAVISANILYMGQGEKDGESYQEPCFYQGKSDFTQFILMNKEENIAATKLVFQEEDLVLEINKESPEEGDFALKGTIKTNVEVYKTIEKEMVTDLYHSSKEITYDDKEMNIETIVGTGAAEVSAREIFNVSEEERQVAKVIYISGRIKESNSVIEQGRCIVEGTMEARILCMTQEDGKKPFAMTQTIPFRGSMEIFEANEGMIGENNIFIKELWFDKINSKQVEVNASLGIETTVRKPCCLKIIENLSYVDKGKERQAAPMVIYIAKNDDTLWKIAKKYKTTRKALREVNNITDDAEIQQGAHLLVVK